MPQDMLLVYLLEGRNPTIWQTPITPRFPSLCPHTSHSGLQSPVPAPSSEVPRAGGNGRESLHHCVRETEREGGLGGGGAETSEPSREGGWRRQLLPPRLSLSAGFTWIGRFICNRTQGTVSEQAWQ